MSNELTVALTARRLGTTLEAIYRLIYAGRLAARKEGKVWRVDAAAVEGRLKAKQAGR